MEVNYSFISIKKRLLAVLFAVIFFLLAIIVRLAFLQVFNADKLTSKAYEQWLRDLPMVAARGKIVDRNGACLVSSYTTYDIYVRPVELKDQEMAAKLISKAASLDYDQTLEKVSKKGMSEVLVAKNQPKEVVKQILSEYVDGIFFTENTSRYYEYGDLLTQILGFVSSDGNGQSGLESQYNKYLRGIDGVSMVESDLRGISLSDSLCYYLPSIDGLTLQLTIDLKIQQAVEQIVGQARLNHGAKSASTVVIDPQTGEILAITTKPSYNLNEVPRDDIEQLLKLSRATTITDAYEPGSTFKIITTAIAMNEGIATEHSYFYCNGYRIANGVKINCHRRTGHGSQSLEQGLKNSCNCVFMELIKRIGLEKFYEYLEAFGVVSGYNLDFPGEGTGVLMPKNLVTEGDLLRMGFGQTIAITPLQLAQSIATCINGGKLMQPYFVSSMTNSSGEEVYRKDALAVDNVLKESVSKSLNKMLLEVVKTGGGKHAYIPGYDIGGKTGTAQKYENGAIAQGKYVASFVGFYPADNPIYEVLVIVDEPQGAYYGGVVSAPIAKEIFEKIFELKETPKSENASQLEKLEQANIEVPNLIGLTLTQAVEKLSELGLQYLTSGDGKTVKDQIAAPQAMVSEGDIVLLIL